MPGRIWRNKLTVLCEGPSLNSDDLISARITATGPYKMVYAKPRAHQHGSAKLGGSPVSASHYGKDLRNF